MIAKSTRRLVVSLVVIALIGGCSGVVSIVFWDRWDPGYDNHLHGLTRSQLLALLGNPTESALIEFHRINEDHVRRRFVADIDRLDDRHNIMLLRWSRNGADIPTVMSTTVWLYCLNGEWTEFDNYRKYHWACL